MSAGADAQDRGDGGSVVDAGPAADSRTLDPPVSIQCELLAGQWNALVPPDFEPLYVLRREQTILSDGVVEVKVPVSSTSTLLGTSAGWLHWSVSFGEYQGFCLVPVSGGAPVSAGAFAEPTFPRFPNFPDGRFIVWTEPERIVVLEAASGNQLTVHEAPSIESSHLQGNANVIVSASEGYYIYTIPPGLGGQAAPEPAFTERYPYVSPSGAYLVYEDPPGDFSNVYLRDVAGSSDRLIASDYKYYFTARWGRDDRVFLIGGEFHEPAYINPTDGSDRVILPFPNDYYVKGVQRFSPDGLHTAYFGRGASGSRGWVIDATAVGPTGLAIPTAASAAFAPDSSRFAVLDQQRFFTVRLDGSELGEQDQVSSFLWAPDSASLLIETASGIAISEPDLSASVAPPDLNPVDGTTIQDLHWSKDGVYIYYTRGQAQQFYAYRYSLASDTSELLSAEPVTSFREIR